MTDSEQTAAERTTLVLTTVRVLRYREPRPSIASDSALPTGFVDHGVHVEGRCGGEPVHAVREGRLAAVGQSAEGAWRSLEAASGMLVGRTVEVGSASSVAGLLREIGAPAGGGRLSGLRRRRSGADERLGALASAIEALAHDPFDAGRSRDPVDLHGYYRAALPDLDRHLCRPEPSVPMLREHPANTYPEARFLRHLRRDGTKGHLLEREALAHGLSTVRFPGASFMASDPRGRRIGFKWSRSPLSSGVALSICNHKQSVRTLLQRAGLPTPRGRMFEKGEHGAARAFASRLGYPVVCKPAAGLRGVGVVADIPDEDALDRALALLEASQLGDDDFVIEEHVTGADYRIVVVGGDVVAAVLREPASVTGDGMHTVGDLIMSKNAFRATNPHLAARPIEVDDQTLHQLATTGLRLDSVPGDGQRVRLSSSSNLSRGGDSVEVLEELHPTIRQAALDAVRAIPRLGFCGVDMLLEDHRAPLASQRAAILELNAHGAIGSGQFPMWGQPREVARAFLLECAGAQGLELPRQPGALLAVKLDIRGRVTGVGYRRWMKELADDFGIEGWVTNPRRRVVRARLVGPTAAVAALANACIFGPRSAIARSVATTPVDPTSHTGFQIRR